MITTDPVPIGIRLTWVDRGPELIDGFDLVIERKVLDGEWTTLLAQRWVGYMVDLAQDAHRSIIHAWLFGDQRDVLRAAVTCHRQAKKHARAHEHD